MSAPVPVARLQRAALYQLFHDLFWRGRQTQRNQKTSKGTILARKGVPVLLFALVGLVLPLMTMGKMPPLIFATLVHAMTFVMVGMTLASTCGTLLFNDQESDILLHRPVPVAMILRAKVRVLLTQACMMALALNAASFFSGVLRSGGSWRYVPAHLLSVTLQALFSVSAVVLAFHLCLRWFGRERLNGLITTSQVVIAMAAMLGGQLVPRMIGKTNLEQWQTSPWLMALPPAWFAALDTLATTLQPTLPLLAGAVTAIVSPLLMAWLAFSKLAGSYEDAVITLNEHTASPGKKAEGGMRWAERLTCWPLMRYWLRDPVERASFLLTAAQLTRARDVKLRVYPQIAQFAVYPLIFAVGSREDSYGIAAGFLSGFLGMIPLTAVGLLRYSEEYRGAELFRFAPVSSPAPLFHGARKAAQCFVFLPVLVIWVLICVLALQRPDQLLLLIPGILTGHICSLFPGTWEGFLPFSETQADRKGMGTGCVIMALGFGGAVTVGIASSMCWKYGYFLPWILALGLICLILDVVLRRVIRSKSLRMDD